MFTGCDPIDSNLQNMSRRCVHNVLNVCLVIAVAVMIMPLVNGAELVMLINSTVILELQKYIENTLEDVHVRARETHENIKDMIVLRNLHTTMCNLAVGIGHTLVGTSDVVRKHCIDENLSMLFH